MPPLTHHALAASGSVDVKLADGWARPPGMLDRRGGVGGAKEVVRENLGPQNPFLRFALRASLISWGATYGTA